MTRRTTNKEDPVPGMGTVKLSVTKRNTTAGCGAWCVIISPFTSLCISLTIYETSKKFLTFIHMVLRPSHCVESDRGRECWCWASCKCRDWCYIDQAKCLVKCICDLYAHRNSMYRSGPQCTVVVGQCKIRDMSVKAVRRGSMYAMTRLVTATLKNV